MDVDNTYLFQVWADNEMLKQRLRITRNYIRDSKLLNCVNLCLALLGVVDVYNVEACTLRQKVSSIEEVVAYVKDGLESCNVDNTVTYSTVTSVLDVSRDLRNEYSTILLAQNKSEGHAIVLRRDERGVLYLIDPQIKTGPDFQALSQYRENTYPWYIEGEQRIRDYMEKTYERIFILYSRVILDPSKQCKTSLSPMILSGGVKNEKMPRKTRSSHGMRTRRHRNRRR
jgi:hypothetical protein